MNKGIEYFTDLNCRPKFKKYHTAGIKNIYKVIIADYDGKKGFTSILPYDSFSLAARRFRIELNHYGNMYENEGYSKGHVFVQCATYNDTKLVSTEEFSGYDMLDMRR